jgi:hypothetical protein
MTGKLIVDKQMEPEQFELLLAKRQLYFYENVLGVTQTLIAVAVAIGGPWIQRTVADSEPIVTVASGIIALFDVVFLESLKGNWQQLAAKMQERFDCNVLALPWRELKSETEPTPEDVAANNYTFFKNRWSADLKEYYPPSIATIPFDFARIICQRENCVYDRRLRSQWITFVSCMLTLLSLSAFAIAWNQNDTWIKTLASIIAPLIPAFVLGIREIKLNVEASKTSERLLSHCEKLWQRALSNGIPAAEAENESRLLQDEIFDNRRRSVVVQDWFYGMSRFWNEKIAMRGADKLVDQYKRINP